MIKSNFHTHTNLCDGMDTPEDMVKTALSLGFTALGFSGHMDTEIHMDFDAYRKEILRLQAEYKDRIDILLGVELDTLYDPAIAQKAEYVIGSTHYIPVIQKDAGSGVTGRFLPPEEVKIPAAPQNVVAVDSSAEEIQRLCDEIYGGDWYALTRDYYRTEATVSNRFPCTFIGHFDLVTRFNDSMHAFDETDPRYTGPALEALEYLAGKGIPFEINCGAVNRGRKKELYPRMEFLRALHSFGAEIVISSDAHDRFHLNGGFDIAENAAREAGYDHCLTLRHNADGAVVWEETPLG